MIVQLPLFPDIPPREKKETSHPLVIYKGGHYLWRVIGSNEYAPAPALERVLLEAQRKEKAA